VKPAAGGLVLGCLTLSAGAEDGPNSSIFSGQGREPAERNSLSPVMGHRTNLMNQSPMWAGPLPTSWYETPIVVPKEVRVEDIVTIRVDMGSKVIANGTFNRRKTARYDAILNNFVTLVGLKAIKPAPQTDGKQEIQGNLTEQFRATGDLQSNESLKFEIAAKIKAVLPNGNLILEASREVRNNEEVWLHSLSGMCRREDIQPGNTVLSKDIADLRIVKREIGHVQDSYKRGFINQLLDKFKPF
jgi:flagellar L-ring protein precursor FlgH